MGGRYFTYKVTAKKKKVIDWNLYIVLRLFSIIFLLIMRGLQNQIFYSYYIFINHLISVCLSMPITENMNKNVSFK